MSSKHEPLRKTERRELAGYVGFAPVAGRAILFIIVVGSFGAFLRYVLDQASGSSPGLANPAWWIAPAAALGVIVFLLARRWTGGRELREKIRADLERGQAAVHTVHVLEGIVVEEREDEGPIVYVQTELMGVIRFAGQYLDREVRRGFPWPEIVIREAPESRIFFGVSGKEGEPVPVLTRGPLTSMEAESLGPFDEEYVKLRLDFETLKTRLNFAKDS